MTVSREKLPQTDQGSTNPELARQEFIKKMIDPTGSQADLLSDLRETEINIIALYRALNLIHRDPYNLDVSGLDEFLNNYVRLRFSLNRKSRAELVTILKPSTVIYSSGGINSQPGEEKPGFFSRLFHRGEQQ